MWNGKHQNVLFLDKRKEVKPDVVGSNEYLPFKNDVFEKVVYDPPHCLRKHIKKPPIHGIYSGELFIKCFGVWDSQPQFLRNIIRVNKEVNRVLLPNGIFFIKYCEVARTKVSHKTMIKLLDNFVLRRKRIEKTKSTSKNKVYFLTLTPLVELYV